MYTFFVNLVILKCLGKRKKKKPLFKTDLLVLHVSQWLFKQMDEFESSSPQPTPPTSSHYTTPPPQAPGSFLDRSLLIFLVNGDSCKFTEIVSGKGWCKNWTHSIKERVGGLLY